MPKMKSHSGAKKRFSPKPSGLIKCKRAKMRHLQKNKSTKLKRGLRKGDYVDPSDAHRVAFMLPYA
jgi:large subunit ribosomal protein L35